MLLFLVKHYTVRMDISRYYLLPNSTKLKLKNQKYEHLLNVFMQFYLITGMIIVNK